jgi:hypothetical protein
MTYEQLRELSFPDLLSLLECTIKHAQEYAKGRDWSPGATTMMPPPFLLEIGDFEILARFRNEEFHPPTSCCNYRVLKSLSYPVMWNEFNRVVQCHNCGHVFGPIP